MAPPQKVQRKGRPHGIPPLPGWRRDFDILDEMAGHGLLGMALWEGLRDVSLWAGAEWECRAMLFARAGGGGCRAYALDAVASHAPELASAWEWLDGASRAPADVARERVAEACQLVYAWAEERAFLKTAAHFAEAAARVKPDAPALANLAARACRRAALLTRAGPWYQRGRALAVRVDDFAEKFSASVGYGWLMYALGRYERAARSMQRAARQALHESHPRMAGEAEHNLLAICSELRAYPLGETYARQALGHYPIHHPLLPFLVHDVAYYYVACAMYTPVLSVLAECIETMPRPQDPVLAWGTLARAAAGAEQESVYRRSRDTALALVDRYPEHAPAALRNVAYAAQFAGEWETAEHAARRAVELAAARRMAEVERTSRELLAEVLARAPGRREMEPPPNCRIAEVMRFCRMRLRQWAGPKRGRPPGKTPPA